MLYNERVCTCESASFWQEKGDSCPQFTNNKLEILSFYNQQSVPWGVVLHDPNNGYVGEYCP